MLKRDFSVQCSSLDSKWTLCVFFNLFFIFERIKFFVFVFRTVYLNLYVKNSSIRSSSVTADHNEFRDIEEVEGLHEEKWQEVVLFVEENQHLEEWQEVVPLEVEDLLEVEVVADQDKCHVVVECVEVEECNPVVECVEVEECNPVVECMLHLILGVQCLQVQ